ncbi:MAG: chorismate mutase [Spirochaetaceae bacterium]|jgi:chorismate mutase|nr:chorismate mutase [Spirochaetaceae bacterium]
MNQEKRLKALRGAACALNEKEDISRQAAALYDALLRENRLQEEDLVSLIFSVTKDLDAENPASALRRSGRAREAALFAVQEADTAGSPARVIRALAHCYLTGEPVHIYRNGAESLRPDRSHLADSDTIAYNQTHIPKSKGSDHDV